MVAFDTFAVGLYYRQFSIPVLQFIRLRQTYIEARRPALGIETEFAGRSRRGGTAIAPRSRGAFPEPG